MKIIKVYEPGSITFYGPTIVVNPHKYMILNHTVCLFHKMDGTRLAPSGIKFVITLRLPSVAYIVTRYPQLVDFYK